MDNYFDRNPLAYWVLISWLVGVAAICFDGLVPTTAGLAKIASLSLAVAGTSVAAGIWAYWLRKRPPYVPFVMDFPSGWNAHRPLILIAWIGAVIVYGNELAKVAGLVQSNASWSFIVFAFTR